MIPCKGVYGLFDDLEVLYGQTTALDIISKELIKKTDAYEEVNEYRDTFKWSS